MADLDGFEDAIAAGRCELRRRADNSSAAARKAYLKTPLEVLGCRVPDVRITARSVHRSHRNVDRARLVAALNRLYRSHVHEERLLAVYLAESYRRRFDAEDVRTLFAAWLDDCHGWDITDSICLGVVGPVALGAPRAWRHVAAWRHDRWLWRRRAAIVCHIPAIRAGRLQEGRLRATCLDLIGERGFFIAKAIGWTLRELSLTDPDLTERLILDLGRQASALTLREALRRMPADRQARLRHALEASRAC